MENAALAGESEISEETPAETIHISNAATAVPRSGVGRRKRRRRISDETCDGVVEEKIAALQRIVPGGAGLPAEQLFEETAEYIAWLERQVTALRFLVAIVDGFEGEKRKSDG